MPKYSYMHVYTNIHMYQHVHISSPSELLLLYVCAYIRVRTCFAFVPYTHTHEFTDSNKCSCLSFKVPRCYARLITKAEYENGGVQISSSFNGNLTLVYLILIQAKNTLQNFITHTLQIFYALLCERGSVCGFKP